MFKIPKIENESFYIDQAMNSMQEIAQKKRNEIDRRFESVITSKKKTRDEINLDKRKDLELEKIRHLNDRINTALKNLIKRFPKFEKVDKIYLDLINTSEVPVPQIKDALARLLWIVNTIDEHTQNTEIKIKRAHTQQTVGFIMKKYLGRVNSYFRKNKEFFKKLDEARKFMNRLPTFENIYTAAIAGFPNVGKSTLMQKVTGSEVEVQNYPFTTKGLMFGYIVESERKYVQLIDTPGLLGRDKNNAIEERAQLVVTDFSDIIVFVIDFTQSCGYDIEAQFKLLKKTANIKKDIIIYLSKTDLFNEETEELREEYKSKLKKYKVYTNSDEIRKHLLEEKKKNTKFDPSKLNLIK